MEIWEKELNSSQLTDKEKDEAKENVKNFQKATSWFRENYYRLPPGISVLINSISVSILENTGYSVKIDPGELPS